MQFVKLGLAIILFGISLSVLLMSPERQTEVLKTLGIGLTQRTLFALSILGTICSAILGIRTIAEEFLMKSN